MLVFARAIECFLLTHLNNAFLFFVDTFEQCMRIHHVTTVAHRNALHIVALISLSISWECFSSQSVSVLQFVALRVCAGVNFGIEFVSC